MTYNEMVRRIGHNLGFVSLNSAFISIAKKDIFDVVTMIMRKAEIPKILFSDVIDDDEDDATNPTSSITLPTDFYIPVEVMFFASSGNRFPEIEMTRETYERWNPNVNLTTESFASIVTSATPQELIWTTENFDFDGYIGYLFTDTQPQTLIWKPAVNGTVKIYYAVFPLTMFTDLTTTPEIHQAFHSTIVDAVTLKMLVRRLTDKTLTEIQFVGIRSSIKEYKESFKESLADFTGYSKKTAETPIMEAFAFLNDPAMELSGYR